MVNRFLKVVSFLKFKFKLSQRYIANAIGGACNSRIPPANLHAELNFIKSKILAFEVIIGNFVSYAFMPPRITFLKLKS
jgi:hypothetical protein